MTGCGKTNQLTHITPEDKHQAATVLTVALVFLVIGTEKRDTSLYDKAHSYLFKSEDKPLTGALLAIHTTK
jgi:hypothetical protein